MFVNYSFDHYSHRRKVTIIFGNIATFLSGFNPQFDKWDGISGFVIRCFVLRSHILPLLQRVFWKSEFKQLSCSANRVWWTGLRNGCEGVCGVEVEMFMRLGGCFCFDTYFFISICYTPFCVTYCYISTYGFCMFHFHFSKIFQGFIGFQYYTYAVLTHSYRYVSHIAYMYMHSILTFQTKLLISLHHEMV